MRVGTLKSTRKIKKIQMFVDEDTYRILKVLGNGRANNPIRKLLAAAKEQMEREYQEIIKEGKVA